MALLLRSGESVNLARTVNHTHGSAVEGGTAIGPLTALTLANSVNVGAFNITALGFISTNLIVDTSTLFVDSLQHSVGIGTTTPDASFRLTVRNNGGIKIEETGASSVNLMLKRDGGVASSAWYLSVVTGGDQFAILRGGNVALHIDNSQNIGLGGVTDEINQLSLPNGKWIGWKNAGSNGGESAAIRSNSNVLEFLTNGAVKNTINSSGQIVNTLTTGTAPFLVSSQTLVSNLNANLLNGLTTGNANGNIPVSNGTLCTNLNAQFWNGLATSDFIRTTGSVAQSINGQKTFTDPMWTTDLSHSINPTAGGAGVSKALINRRTMPGVIFQGGGGIPQIDNDTIGDGSIVRTGNGQYSITYDTIHLINTCPQVTAQGTEVSNIASAIVAVYDTAGADIVVLNDGGAGVDAFFAFTKIGI